MAYWSTVFHFFWYLHHGWDLPWELERCIMLLLCIQQIWNTALQCFSAIYILVFHWQPFSMHSFCSVTVKEEPMILSRKTKYLDFHLFDIHDTVASPVNCNCDWIVQHNATPQVNRGHTYLTARSHVACPRYVLLDGRFMHGGYQLEQLNGLTYRRDGSAAPRAVQNFAGGILRTLNPWW